MSLSLSYICWCRYWKTQQYERRLKTTLLELKPLNISAPNHFGIARWNRADQLFLGRHFQSALESGRESQWVPNVYLVSSGETRVVHQSIAHSIAILTKTKWNTPFIVVLFYLHKQSFSTNVIIEMTLILKHCKSYDHSVNPFSASAAVCLNSSVLAVALCFVPRVHQVSIPVKSITFIAHKQIYLFRFVAVFVFACFFVAFPFLRNNQL